MGRCGNVFEVWGRIVGNGEGKGGRWGWSGESVFLFLEKTLETAITFYAEDGDA